jgi:hypothetical protein
LANRYYGSFAPGLQHFIAEILEGSGLRIVRLLEGAVIFDTPFSYDRLNLPCFNNIFQVIRMTALDRPEALEAWIAGTAARRSGVAAENSREIRSFRVIFSRENVPAALDGRLRNQVENCISRESGLRVNRSLPDTEFWFLYRREGGGLGLFMKRLTRRPSFDKILHRGELPPPLAWTLCRLSNPKAGRGSPIPSAVTAPSPRPGSATFPRPNFSPPTLTPPLLPRPGTNSGGRRIAATLTG